MICMLFLPFFTDFLPRKPTVPPLISIPPELFYPKPRPPPPPPPPPPPEVVAARAAKRALLARPRPTYTRLELEVIKREKISVSRSVSRFLTSNKTGKHSSMLFATARVQNISLLSARCAHQSPTCMHTPIPVTRVSLAVALHAQVYLRRMELGRQQARQAQRARVEDGLRRGGEQGGQLAEPEIRSGGLGWLPVAQRLGEEAGGVDGDSVAASSGDPEDAARGRHDPDPLVSHSGPASGVLALAHAPAALARSSIKLLLRLLLQNGSLTMCSAHPKKGDLPAFEGLSAEQEELHEKATLAQLGAALNFKGGQRHHLFSKELMRLADPTFSRPPSSPRRSGRPRLRPTPSPQPRRPRAAPPRERAAPSAAPPSTQASLSPSPLPEEPEESRNLEDMVDFWAESSDEERA